eukprot:20008-Heterococcus_DN1.PRE.1
MHMLPTGTLKCLTHQLALLLIVLSWFVTRALLHVMLGVPDTLSTSDCAYQQLYKPTHKPSKCGYSRSRSCYTQYCYYNAVCAPYAKAAVDFT